MANGATHRTKKKKPTNSQRGKCSVWLFVTSLITNDFGKYQPTKTLNRMPPSGMIIFADTKSKKSKKVMPNRKRTSDSGPKLSAHKVPSAMQEAVTTHVAARRDILKRSSRKEVTGSCRLIMLVSALAGREHVLAAYREAVEQRYRFFSFGDAMFIH